MSRWEDKYNELAPNIDNRISELEGRIQEQESRRDVKPEEFDTYKKELEELKAEKEGLEQLKPNLEKVKNILEVREQVEARLEEYYEVKDIQDKVESNKNQIQENEQKIQENEKAYQKAIEEIKQLEEELSHEGLGEDEKREKLKKITEATTRKTNAWNENNSFRMKNDSLKKENDKLENSLEGKKYGNLSKEQVDAQIEKLGAVIVIFNKACSNLMKGKEAGDITYDKTQHTYTRPKTKRKSEPKKDEPKKDEPKKDEPKKDEPKKDEPKKVEFQEDEPKKVESKKIEPKKVAPKKVVPKKDENAKQGIFSRMKKFFKKVRNKLFNTPEMRELGAGFSEEEKKVVIEEVTENKDNKEARKASLEELIELLGGKPKKEESEEIKETVELSDKEMDRMAEDLLSDPSKVTEIAEQGKDSFREGLQVKISEEQKARLEQWRKENGYRPEDQIGPTGLTEQGKEAMEKITAASDKGKTANELEVMLKMYAHGRGPGQEGKDEQEGKEGKDER